MSTKSHTILTLFLLTTTTTTLLLHPATAGDNQPLIDKLCGATFAPAACLSCIKDSPPSPTTTTTTTTTAAATSNDITTEVDVLEKLLSCAETDMQALEKSIVAILDGEADPTTKKAMVDCQPLIASAIQNGGSVYTDVANKKYDAAKNEINTGIEAKLGLCDSVIKSAGITIPPTVFSGMFVVEGDFKMIYQILQTLKSPVTYKVRKY